MTEKELTEFRSLIAKRKGMTGTITNAAPMHRAPVAAALQARVDAGKAMLAAAEAKVRAKQAVAALQPAPRAVQLPAAKMPPGLDGKARREWAKSQTTMTAANATRFDDTYLQVAATHRNSPPAEAAVARAELTARGFIFHPGGITSKSNL